MAEAAPVIAYAVKELLCLGPELCSVLIERKGVPPGLKPLATALAGNPVLGDSGVLLVLQSFPFIDV